MTTIDVILDAIRRELVHAQMSYPAFHSQHEGAAVIREEYDELWDRSKRSKLLTADGVTGIEAMQTAAMAVRFIADLCDEDDFTAALRSFESAR